MLVAESRMVMGKAHVFHVGSLSYIQFTSYLTGRNATHYTLDCFFLKFIAIGLLFRGHYLITSWSYFTIRL